MPVLKEPSSMWKADPVAREILCETMEMEARAVCVILCTSRDKQVHGHTPRSDFCAAM